jgi:putative urate catabolism protein
MRGYGQHTPDPNWPGGARIAVQFVLNYEEGGENCILHGDAASEAFLSDIPGAAPWPGQRHWNMESVYEYGARAGFWRLHRLLTGAGIPVTVYGVASALARSPEQVEAMQAAGWEIASHGLKWVEHKDMPEAEERAAIAQAIRLHTEVVGDRPRGWYTGRCSVNTLRLIAEEGGFDYISDSYDDDLPHWREVSGHSQLVIPYTLEANDMRFAMAPGYATGAQFFEYLKDSFDVLYAEGTAGAPKMMSIGLHCRLIGRPGKLAGLQRFIDYIARVDHVWCPRRIDIARHWATHHPPAPGIRVSDMADEALAAFLQKLIGDIPEVIARAVALERGPAHDCADGVHSLLCRALRQLPDSALPSVAARLDPQAAPSRPELRQRIEAACRARVTAHFAEADNAQA